MFKIFHGLKFYCTERRHNNSQHGMARRQVIVPPMFIGNPLINQIILLNCMKEWLEARKEVYDIITSKESFSRSGDKHRGERGNYITGNE